MTDETPTRYRFPGVDGGWWLGLRPLPLAWLAGVLAVTVVGLYVGAPLPFAMAALLTGSLAALVPVGDRSTVEWLPPAARAAARRVAVRHRWHDRTALRPVAVRRPTTCRLPAHLGGQQVANVDGVGVIDDRRHSTAVGLLAVAGTDRFVLSEPTEQSRLLDGWGTALAGLGADPRVKHLQWIERAAPEDRDIADWLRKRAAGPDDAVADYLHLVRDVTAQTSRHEVWLAVAFDRSVATASVPGALADVAGQLLAARLIGRPLSASEVTTVLRRCLAGPAAVGAQVQRMGPLSLAQSWQDIRVDDCLHRGFAVTGWPRLPLAPGWLEPLFLSAPAGVARIVSVHLHPVPAAEAMRRARSARSRARLDASDRARLGLLDSARVDADAAEAAAAEEELVAGYRLHRLCGVVVVSASTARALDEGGRAVRTAAETARLELRPLHGQHAAALRAALPLCRPGGRAR